MARLTDANVSLARDIIGRYPKPKSALIPLLHLSQEQNGYVTHEAMAHIAELVGVTPAEVLGTATFYEMFKFEPVGKYVVNICQTMSCALMGATELMHHAEQRLGVPAGGTTPDGMITIEHAECQAACTEAPVPAGQLPIPLPGHPRRPRRPLRRSPRRSARRRDPAPRHAGHGPPAHPERQGRRRRGAGDGDRTAAVDPDAAPRGRAEVIGRSLRCERPSASEGAVSGCAGGKWRGRGTQ